MKVKLVACIASTCCTPAFSRSRADVNRISPIRHGRHLSKKRSRNRSEQAREPLRYYVRLTNCPTLHKIAAQLWLSLVAGGLIEPESPNSRIAVGRHARAIFLRDGLLVYVGNTYALGIPLMTNAKIMDSYLCSYQYLEPEEVERLVQEQYNPFLGGPIRLRPTEEQNARNLAAIQPLVEWREALRQNEQRAA